MKKQIVKPMKLIDILNDTESQINAEKLTHVKQCDINTQQEILDVSKSISAQDAVIDKALRANPFSASNLYKERKQKQLLEMKLEALQQIHKELF